MGSPPPIQFATLGMWDTLLLMVLALVVFGPRRLPMIGRQLGKLMYEFRKASNDFKFQMEEELRTSEEADRRKKAEEERQRAVAAAPPPQLEAATSQTPAPAAETQPAAETLGPVETQEAAASQESRAPVLAESPYSEGTDPNIGTQTTNRAEEPPSIEIAPPETPSPETAPPAIHSPDPESHPAPAATIPHIQPPSTGEKIAANPPGKTQGSLFPEAEGSEPASHHG
jgi:sec-independent protein translocase protein TatB